MDKIAVHESRGSEKVVRFINIEDFTEKFQEEHNSGNITGVFLDENGNIVAENIWQEILENILN